MGVVPSPFLSPVLLLSLQSFSHYFEVVCLFLTVLFPTQPKPLSLIMFSYLIYHIIFFIRFNSPLLISSPSFKLPPLFAFCVYLHTQTCKKSSWLCFTLCCFVGVSERKKITKRDIGTVRKQSIAEAVHGLPAFFWPVIFWISLFSLIFLISESLKLEHPICFSGCFFFFSLSFFHPEGPGCVSLQAWHLVSFGAFSCFLNSYETGPKAS